jgi:hypothetical protein
MRTKFPVFLALFLLVGSAFGADVVGPGPYESPLPKESSVYAHVGPLNLVLPWNDLAAVYLFDINSKTNLVGGEAVVASIWRVQATVGAVMDLDGNGNPFIGGNLWLPNPVPAIAFLNDIKPGIFGGFDWRRGESMFGFKAAIPIFN